MKFLEFVSCCGPARASRAEVRPDLSSSSSSSSSSEMAAAAEETRSLVQSSRYRRRRKRGRLGAAGSAPVSAEWKPSLCSISEDNVVIMVERSDHHRQDHDQDRGRDRTAGSERLVKRKSDSRSSSRMNVVVTSFNDDYGRSSFPTVIPAFSPTPFMF